MKPDSKILDRWTNIDNLLAENTTVLRELKQETIITNTSLQLIAEKLGAQAIAPRYDATFPLTGTQEILAGKTTFNFKNGDVLTPGTEAALRMSHPMPGIVRSIEIITEKEIRLELYEEDRSELVTSIFPRMFRKTFLEFTRAEITAYGPTNVWLAVSTEPEGVPELNLADYKEGNPFIDRDTIAVAGTPNTVDVRGTLNRNVHDGYITNMGVGVGILHVYFTADGTNWTTEYATINPFGVFNIIDDDIAQLRIDTDVNATQYEIYLS